MTTIKQEQDQIKKMIDKLDCSACLNQLKEKIKDIRIRHNSERIERGVGRTGMYDHTPNERENETIKKYQKDHALTSISSEATIIAMTCWDCHSDKMELKTQSDRISIYQCPMCGAYASLSQLGKLTVR